MQHLSTASLIIALAIVARRGGVTADAHAHFFNYDQTDQVAEEAKNRAVTIVDGPKYVAPPLSPAPNTSRPEKPKKPKPAPDKPNGPNGKTKYVIEIPRLYYGQLENLPPLRSPYSKPLHIHHAPNSVYKYHKVIPVPPKHKHQPLAGPVFAASTIRPSHAKSPKFTLPVETVNGIRADFVRPPALNTTTTSTTTVSTTTRHLRTKRIWPKHVLEKMQSYKTRSQSNNSSNSSDSDLSASSSHHRYVYTERTVSSTPHSPSTKGPYRRVTRVPKKRATTPTPDSSTLETNDWVPITPPHYPFNKLKVRTKRETPSRRSDRADIIVYDLNTRPTPKRQQPQFPKSFLQSYGHILSGSQIPASTIRNMVPVYQAQGSQLKPHYYSGSRRRPVAQSSNIITEYPGDDTDPKILTRIKHHHHHHHHRYVKTVEKKVKVEVPKPVPVAVPMPVPVQVEKKVPYPVKVQVPHPVPVKVIEKEYVPKPYPVYQIKHVPQPYPVEVQVPVPQPYAVHVEKKVPYPVPVRVMVPQPYAVKEPVEVIKEVRVGVPQPYPVRVPYPVEVEKKVPVPFRVLVPEKVEVEKKVPVYIPRPYPVEKRVPVPVKVPVKVPVGIPIIIHPKPSNEEDRRNSPNYSHYAYSVHGDQVTQTPDHGRFSETVTYHGNTVTSPSHGVRGYQKMQSRSDNNVFDSAEENMTTASALSAVTSSNVTASSEESQRVGFSTVLNESISSSPSSTTVQHSR